jgi:hypothetical protein
VGQEEQTDELFDFLYRDSGRITSLYAQIFGGHLSSLEETDSERRAKDRSGRLAVPVASGELKSTQETLVSSKRVFNPHDLIVTDVLASLNRNSRIRTSAAEAPHGALVREQGTLAFIDRHMLELACVAFEASLTVERKKRPRERDAQVIQTLEFLQTLLGKIALPSAFLLQTAAGVQIGGTIKDEGMQEPISTYYFKHGTAGLSDVFVVGIKEQPSLAFALPETALLGASQQAAQGLSDLLFPKEAIRVTPVALFRKI